MSNCYMMVKRILSGVHWQFFSFLGCWKWIIECDIKQNLFDFFASQNTVLPEIGNRVLVLWPTRVKSAAAIMDPLASMEWFSPTRWVPPYRPPLPRRLNQLLTHRSRTSNANSSIQLVDKPVLAPLSCKSIQNRSKVSGTVWLLLLKYPYLPF